MIRFFPLLVSAAALMAHAAEMPRALFGVMVEPAPGRGGAVVKAVKPGSPANAAGVMVGDVLRSINGDAVRSRDDVRAALAKTESCAVAVVELLREGEKTPLIVEVALADRAKLRRRWEANVVGAFPDSVPVIVPPQILSDMAAQRRNILLQLASLKEGFAPNEVTQCLQAIRHLARDANQQKLDWMPGEAGEVILRFKDQNGILELYGADKKLQLTVYRDFKCETAEGRWPLNTEVERKAVPEEITARLKMLR